MSMSKRGNNRVLGEVGENNVRCDLSQKGYVVSTNDEGDKADFTVRVYKNGGESRSEYFGTQTKYAGGEDKNTYQVVLETSSGGVKNTRTFAKYKLGDFEVFSIDFTENFGKVAYIPHGLVRSQPNETLIIRITPPINGCVGQPCWPIWDFLSIEKARLCDDIGTGYRQRFSGEKNDEDAKLFKMWSDLEGYIQYQWFSLNSKSPYSNELIDKIKPSSLQYPSWFRAHMIGNQNWKEFGEEPWIDQSDVRPSNSTTIRADLKKVPSKSVFDLSEQWMERPIRT